MKHLIFAVVLISVCTLTVSVNAEIYKYVDENGQPRWTDDLSQVPKNQRDKIKSYKSIESTTKPSAPATHDRDAAGIDDEKKMGAHGEAIDTRRDSLEKEKADLERQYQHLAEERKNIEKLKADAGNADETKDLNRRINEYNEKTENYEAQLNQFNEKVNTYNRKKQSKPSKSD